MHTNQRLYALDKLRACLMWLGIVLHAAVNHMASPSEIPWRDSQVSPAADLLVLLIHAFRMPLFFVLAGFFLARLHERHGALAMLRHRLRRLGLPLLVFWPVLTVATGLLVLMFVHLMKRGVIGIDPSLLTNPDGAPRLGRMHLWFIVDLLWLSVAAYALVHYVPAGIGQRVRRTCALLCEAWWGGLCLALPLALLSLHYPRGLVMPSPSFVPDIPELLHFGLFTLVGWHAYAQRDVLLAQLGQAWKRNALAGLVGFIASVAALSKGGNGMLLALLYACTAWAWSFALLGIFSRTAQQPSTWLNYLSASSYWVYLVHMVGTIGFGVLLYRATWGVGPKLLVNIAATTAVSLISYHLFVRRTWIGKMLNGAGTMHTPIPSRENRYLPKSE